MFKEIALGASLLASLSLADSGYNYNSYSYGGDSSWETTSSYEAAAAYTTSSSYAGWTTTQWESAETLSTTVVNVGETYTSESWATCTDEASSPPSGYFPPSGNQQSSWGSGYGGSYGWSGDTSGMMIQVVQVGFPSGQLAYWPEKIVAPPGSMVQFQFNPKNHTVSESSFSSPCQPITLTSPSVLNATHPGVFSGYVPVSAEPANSTVQNIAIFNVLVNSTAPTWIYCSQGDHCQQGMAMVINEPDDEYCESMSSMMPNATKKTLEVYKQMAAMIPVSGGYSSGGSTYGSASYGSGGWGSSSYAAPTLASVVTGPFPPSSAPATVAEATTPAPPAPETVVSASPSVFYPASSSSALPAGVSAFAGAAGGSMVQGLDDARKIVGGLAVILGVFGTLL